MGIGLHFNGTNSYCTIPVSVTNASSWELTIDLVTDYDSSYSSNIYHQACILGYDSSGYKSRDFHVDIRQGNLYIFSGLLGSNSASQLVYGTLTTASGDFGWDTDKFIADGVIHTIHVTYADNVISVYLDNDYLGYLNTTKTINSSALYLGSSYTGEKVYARFDLYNFEMKIDNTLAVRYQPTASTVADMTLVDGSGNNNDGTLRGTFSTVEANTVVVCVDTERTINNASITVDVDTSRKIKNSLFVWRYENPGSAELLSITGGTTVTDLSESESLTGEAFYQPTRSACFGIAATKELWIRCDIYTTGNYANNNRLRIYNDNNTYGANGFSTAATITNRYMLWHNNTTQNGNSYYGKSARRSFLMHMLSDDTNGIVEVWTGSDYFSYTGNVNGGLDFDNVYIQMDGSNIYVSNLIISNAEIDIGEGAHIEYIDTEREITIDGLSVTVDIDTERRLQNAVTSVYDMSRIVARSVSVDADTVVIVTNKAKFNIDIERKLNRSVIVFCDLWRKIPHVITDNSAGLQSWSVSIQEQQLTDNITFVIAGDIEIMDSVDLDILDYELMARAEQTSKRGILLTCQCTCDIDEILYKQLAYEVPESEWEWTEEYLRYIGQWQDDHPDTEVEPLPTCPASAHIKSIASVLGKNVSLQFDDWISTLDTTVSSGTNYAGLIEELFGWTSRLPHIMINCYMRGDTIYVVQRGHEDNEIDIDSEKLTVHTVVKKLVRTTWGSDPWSKTEVKPYYNNWQECEVEPVQEEYQDDADTGTRTYNDDGLVQETEVQHGSERVVTTYEYEDLGDGRKILATETAVTYQGGVEVDRVVTKHNPVGTTQSHVYSEDSDGILGGVVTSSNNDDRITPYQREASLGGSYYGADKPGVLVTTKDGGYGVLWRITYHNDKIDMQKRTINGVALIDTSFPVDGNDALEALTNEIKWLDRKTEESVTLDIYDYPHLIDFNDRIVWHGHTYYLRSNTAIKTETIVNKQTLQFVRWY